MSKRIKFFAVSLFLGCCFWSITWLNVESRFLATLLLGCLTYILSAWVLFEDLKGWEWITLLILPLLFTLGGGFFENLLPPAIPRFLSFNFQIETAIFLAGLLRFLFAVFYVFGMYTILLTENIFSVASIRTIQLFRAARSWSFIMQLVTSTFFFVLAFSLKVPFYVIGGLVGLISFLLAFGGLWSIDLKTEHMDEVKRLSLLVGYLMLLFGLALSFWPVKAFMGGLALTSCFYSLMGILEQRLLNKVTMVGQVEFIIFNLVVLLVTFLTTSWRG